MSSRLLGKVAIVTGAGTGIGRACALAMAREGSRLALVGRREQKLQDLAKEIGNSAVAIAADLSKKTDIETDHSLDFAIVG